MLDHPVQLDGSVAVRYKQVEDVLSKIFLVPPAKLKAFRGRLRHLRNIGIPYDLEKPGRGSQISYTREHLVELLIALELESLGLPPRFALSSYLEALRFPPEGMPRTDVYMIIHPGSFLSGDTPAINVCRADSQELGEVVRNSGTVCVINLSSSLKELDNLLEEGRRE